MFTYLTSDFHPFVITSFKTDLELPLRSQSRWC